MLPAAAARFWAMNLPALLAIAALIAGVAAFVGLAVSFSSQPAVRAGYRADGGPAVCVVCALCSARGVIDLDASLAQS